MIFVMEDTADITFAEAWATWLDYRRCGLRPLRLSTLADYESIYRRHLAPHLAHGRLTDIDGSVIARLVVALSTAGVGGKRLSNVLVPLRACLRWHHRIGTLAPDPSRWFEPTHAPAAERLVLTVPEVERLLCALAPAHRAFVATAAYTGMRAGEIRALTWEDVDLDAGTISVTKALYRTTSQLSTKTGRNRTVPIPPHLAEVLRAERESLCPARGDLVFAGPSGRPVDLDNFRSRVFRPAVEAAGLPEGLRIHDLRHTSASLYLQSGATLREVMEIHGWSQLQTAQRYLHRVRPLSEAASRLSEQRAQALSGADPPLVLASVSLGINFACVHKRGKCVRVSPSPRVSCSFCVELPFEVA